MISKDQVPRIVGHPAYDSSHHKVGDVGQVYLDTATGEPEWMSVRTGMFGTRETFVPLGPAEVAGDEVLVPFGLDKIKHAPRVDTEGGQLPASEEARLYEYYGLQYRPHEQGRRTEAGGETEQTRAAGPDLGLASGTTTAAGAGLREEEARSREAGMAYREAEFGPGTAGTTETDALTRSEERLLVGTEWQESGRARLHKYVVTEDQQQTIPVREERVHVVHEPISEQDRDRLAATADIGEGDREVVLRSEHAVVETEAVPVERVRLDKETVTHDETVGRQVRKERIDVEGVTDVEGVADEER